MFSGPSRWFTGRKLVLLARICLALTATVAALLYADGTMSPPLAAISAYMLAIFLMLSLPRSRSADLIATGAIWMTLAEFCAAISGDRMDAHRWLYAMAALGAAILPMRAQRLRDYAAAHPYRPFAERRRRTSRRRNGPKPGPLLLPPPEKP